MFLYRFYFLLNLKISKRSHFLCHLYDSNYVLNPRILQYNKKIYLQVKFTRNKEYYISTINQFGTINIKNENEKLNFNKGRKKLFKAQIQTFLFCCQENVFNWFLIWIYKV